MKRDQIIYPKCMDKTKPKATYITHDGYVRPCCFLHRHNAVEGHTDNVPVAFSERFKSNWDLSAARAASIADFLLNSTNLEGGNVQIAGFADTRPLDTNDTATGRARNRRIEVIVDDN